MTTKKLIRTVAVAGLTLASMPTLAASVFDFANLKWNGTTNAGFLPSDGISCTGGDLCSSNVDGNIRNGDLTYTVSGLIVHATGFYGTNQVAVVQDHENGYNGLLSGSTAIGAGLGVYHVSGNTSDDNITTGETLKLSFNQVVSLSTLGLRAEGHNTTGWISNATFQYSTDGSSWTSALLPENVGALFSLGLTSSDFYFRYGGTVPDQFYVSSVTVTAVPEPETYAMLLAGLGLLGFAARRRTLKEAAAA